MDDVNLAKKSYGPDVGEIKGKNMRNRPKIVVRNIVDITEEFLEVHQDLTFPMDGLTVNSLKFLSTISHELYYRTVKYFTKTVASVYEGCMDILLAVYKKGGFNITDIYCGNEYCKVIDPVLAKQDLPIKMNYAAVQEYVPQAEK